MYKQNNKINNHLKLYVKFNHHKLDFMIKDLNIYNVLALAVLKELKLNLNKIKTVLKNIEPSEGRGKEYLISRHRKRNLDLLMRVTMLTHYQ